MEETLLVLDRIPALVVLKGSSEDLAGLYPPNDICWPRIFWVKRKDVIVCGLRLSMIFSMQKG